MPRKAIHPSPDVRPLIDKIGTYLTAESLTLNRFCERARLDQPSLFRFMAGQRKTVTRVAASAEAFIDSRHKRHKSGRQGKLLGTAKAESEKGQAVIDNAVQTHWDGSPRSAELIAMLIRAVAPVIEAAGKE